jgi:hypothetical protein
MSELRIERWTMPAATLGPENPLPPLGLRRETPAGEEPYGHLPNTLPYTTQDGYTRDLQPREFRVAVLENDVLRAAFLLEFGGRLWSLLHKPSGRELLEVNPVFQLANLALRNAWFSGGVEWNVGTIGHSPFTCTPLFAARLTRADDTPILRLYEWERFRGVPFQIDATLPDGSPVLFVRVRLVNPNEYDVPMYWWSNIAVPQTRETRIIAPAESALCLGCQGRELTQIPMPLFAGRDITYPSNAFNAADYFFELPEGQRPWITALDGEGKGLVHTSTDRQYGRKLWVWGEAPGGRNWQQFLSPPGEGYVEIQAGLARTQLEHLRMPAAAEWSWLEAYGLIEADPAAVHGSDWGQAQEAVEERLERLISRAAHEAEYERSAAFADQPPQELLQRGSGWGSLERLRREAAEETPFCGTGLIFGDESLGEAQRPWLSLLREGTFPAGGPDDAPRGYMVRAPWRDLLEKTAESGPDTSWLGWLHLGVMHHYAGNRDSARRAWEQSWALAETPWALHNLAAIAQEEGDLSGGADLLIAACRLKPDLLPLAVECGRCLIAADRPRDWLDLLADLPDSIRAAGRIRLLEAQAALAAGDLPVVEHFFTEGVTIPDLREGETTLSDLWFGFHEALLSAEQSVPVNGALRAQARRAFPLPNELDFRIVEEETALTGQ